MDNTKIQATFADKKKLVKALLVFSLIIISWLAFPTNRLWHIIDTGFARLFNDLFVYSTTLQKMVLFFNSRSADWIFDVVIIGFMTIAFKMKKNLSLTTVLVAITICAAVQITSFRIYSRRIIPVTFQYHRKSPSISLKGYVKVQDLIPNCKTKDSSGQSFPGDHATTCALFFILSTILFGRKYGVIAFILSLPILLARCLVGAHWMSDIIVGSCAMVLMYLALIFYSPLFDNIIKKVTFIRRKASNVTFRRNL